MAKKKSPADEWFLGIKKDHNVTIDGRIGVEIVGRFVIDHAQYSEIEEVLEKMRETGAAEVTKQIQF